MQCRKPEASRPPQRHADSEGPDSGLEFSFEDFQEDIDSEEDLNSESDIGITGDDQRNRSRVASACVNGNKASAGPSSKYDSILCVIDLTENLEPEQHDGETSVTGQSEHPVTGLSSGLISCIDDLPETIPYSQAKSSSMDGKRSRVRRPQYARHYRLGQPELLGALLSSL